MKGINHTDNFCSKNMKQLPKRTNIFPFNLDRVSLILFPLSEHDCFISNIEDNLPISLVPLEAVVDLSNN